jgi:hypothetical protein
MDASEVELPQQPHGPGLVQQPQAPPSSAVTPLSPPLPLPPLPFLSPFFAPPSMASFLASFCTPRKHRAIRRQRADSKTCNQHDMEHTSSASCTTATRPRDPGAPAIMSCAPAGMSCAPHAPQRFRAGQRRHGRAAHRICTQRRTRPQHRTCTPGGAPNLLALCSDPRATPSFWRTCESPRTSAVMRSFGSSCTL